MDYRWSTTGLQKYASWWDDDKNFVSAAFYTGAASPPSGAAYIRVSPRHNETPPATFMLVAGDSLPSTYQPPASQAIERQSNKDQAGGYAGLDVYGKLNTAVIPAGIGMRILEGKTIAGLGDSITWGFIPRNAPGYPGQLQSWLPLVAEELGASPLNYGLSGSTLGANSSGADQPMSRRFSAMSDAADLVIVMGGTNDVRKSVPLGVMGDTADTTYYGALDVLCQGLLQKYRYAQGEAAGAGKKIMFMTPIRLLDIGSPDDLHPTLGNYAAAMKEVCARYSIPVFDAYNLSGLTPNLFRTLVGTEPGYTDIYNPYVADGTHPTQEGHQILASAVAGFIRTLY